MRRTSKLNSRMVSDHVDPTQYMLKLPIFPSRVLGADQLVKSKMLTSPLWTFNGAGSLIFCLYLLFCGSLWSIRLITIGKCSGVARPNNPIGSWKSHLSRCRSFFCSEDLFRILGAQLSDLRHVIRDLQFVLFSG